MKITAQINNQKLHQLKIDYFLFNIVWNRLWYTIKHFLQKPTINFCCNVLWNLFSKRLCPVLLMKYIVSSLSSDDIFSPRRGSPSKVLRATQICGEKLSSDRNVQRDAEPSIFSSTVEPPNIANPGAALGGSIVADNVWRLHIFSYLKLLRFQNTQ